MVLLISMVQFLEVVRMADTASAVTGMLTERKTSQDLASTTQRIQAGQYHHTIELVVFTAGYCVQKKIPTCSFSNRYFTSEGKQNLSLYGLPCIQIKYATIKAKRKVSHVITFWL